jgi:hypothetical protein
VKVFSDQAKDGGVFTFRLRMAIDRTPIVSAEKVTRTDNLRACDILRRNEQYRQFCRDLSGQVATLQAQVDRLAERAPPPRQVTFQRLRTGAVQTRPITFQDQGTRSRPPITFQFESDASARHRKRSSGEEDEERRDLDSDIPASLSDDGGVTGATIIIEDDDSDERPRRRTTVHDENEGAPVQSPSELSEGSFASDDDVAPKKASDQNPVAYLSSETLGDFF